MVKSALLLRPACALCLDACCFGDIQTPVAHGLLVWSQISWLELIRVDLLQVVTEHAAIARGTACPPFVAMEACREHIGEHPCDRRRPISEQRRDFPGVDFSLVRSLWIQ